MHKYGENKTTRIMIATSLPFRDLENFLADGFLLDRLYNREAGMSSVRNSVLTEEGLKEYHCNFRERSFKNATVLMCLYSAARCVQSD